MTFSKTIRLHLRSTIVALLVFFAISAFYFAPQFRGKTLRQSDVEQYEGMTRDIKQMRQERGEDPQWTGGMFGGMPAYLINIAYPAQKVKSTVGQFTKILDTPASFTFFAMCAMWVMLLVFGINPWIGIIAALAYGLSTYFMLIIGAGHITKMWALVYAPMMLAGAWMTLRQNMWYGAAFTALFTSLEIGANHPQITYYFLVTMAALWLNELVQSIRTKALKQFSIRTLVLAFAGLVAVGSNFSPLWYTAQHTKETIRGGSELSQDKEQNAPKGLDLDYATQWSYGRAETLNLIIPAFQGSGAYPSDGQTAEVMRRYGNAGMEKYLPTYWGDQPFTAGPTYLGASVVLLALLALVLLEGRSKWWILGVSVLMILLSWGHNWMWFTELAFRYLPFYNKFRTVSMTLVVVQWSVPLLAAMFLMRLKDNQIEVQKLKSRLILLSSIVGGFALMVGLFPSLFTDFGAKKVIDMVGQMTHNSQMIDQISSAMLSDRQQMLSGDAWRTLFIVLATAASVGLFLVKSIKHWIPLTLLGFIVVGDLYTVDRRFLSDEHFVAARNNRVMPTDADRTIMQDKDLGYRVLNLTVNPFSDATTSYFHRSVGGYHGAKLARYQDLIDHYLIHNDEEILNMLNTRYVILPDQEHGAVVERMPNPNGAAWFVENVVYADSPQEEIELLAQIDNKTTAVVSQKDALTNFGEGSIQLTQYRPNYLRYQYEAPTGGTAVFSEIYYDKGWTATIDGKDAHYVRADYVLRAMQLPAGRHTVEWRFHAPHWDTVEWITLLSSIIVLAGAALALAHKLYTHSKNTTQTA